MAITSVVNEAQSLSKKFSFKPMKNFVDYSQTANMGSQTIAVTAASSADIMSTGTALGMLNGQPFECDVDSTLDISASTTETSLTAWATATSYSVGNVRSNGGMRYLCVAAHTSRDSSDSDYIANEPGNSDNWGKYWEQAQHTAVNAAGDTITKAYDKWYLVTATKGGVLNVWVAGDEAAADGAECKIPQFDPKTYMAVGFMHIVNGTSSTFTLGTTTWSTSSIDQTFFQVIGPVYPHADNWDAN